MTIISTLSKTYLLGSSTARSGDISQNPGFWAPNFGYFQLKNWRFLQFGAKNWRIRNLGVLSTIFEKKLLTALVGSKTKIKNPYLPASQYQKKSECTVYTLAFGAG